MLEARHSSLAKKQSSGAKMFIVRNRGGRIAAAYLDEQYRGQEWVPIDSRSLQVFLAAAPAVRRR